ncbi:MAG TPA: SBBP repeat-containing protein, partial [Pseudacidobacterium sp.]|nr:SBBP repeat-containing protein [Pseudacidobacterium sp.]
MLARILPLPVCAGLLVLSCVNSLHAQTQSRPTSDNAHFIQGIPLAFEENDGQLTPDMLFLGRAQSHSVGITRDGLRFRLPASEIDVHFAGSRGGSPVPLSSAAFYTNYFVGNDAACWHEGIPNYSRVGVRGIYPGIDTEFYEKNGELEHDFVVAPGADALSVALELTSTRPATLTSGGDVVIPAENGELRFRKPVAFQYDADGKRVAVQVSYQLAKNEMRFQLGAYDHSRTLVIDPVILFATYLSGSSGSTPAQVAADTSGNIYLSGTTTSPYASFPTPAGGVNSGGAAQNIFVAKLTNVASGSNSMSTVKWITFLGGNGNSQANAMALGSSLIYVGGQTAASNFPGVTGSFMSAIPSKSGTKSGVVASLNTADGTLPTAPSSTYIVTDTSGNAADETAVSALALDSTGNVYIAGYGQGNSLVVTNGLGTAASPQIPTEEGTNNAFVIELNSSLKTPANLITYVQSQNAGDYKATGIQVDSATVPNIYVSGLVDGTTAPSFLTFKSFDSTGAYSEANDFSGCAKTSGNAAAFLAQIVPANGSGTHTSIGFSALTCGDGSDAATYALDTAPATPTLPKLALNASDVYLVGATTSTDFATKILFSNASTASATASPTAGLQSTAATGQANGFALGTPISGSTTGQPATFTYIGGASGDTTLLGVATDTSNGGLVQLAGGTKAQSTDMPASTTATLLGQTTASSQPAGTSKGFLYTLSSDLATAKSISYFGSAATNSEATSVQSDGAGDAYVLVDDNYASVSGSTAFSFTSGSAAQTSAFAGDNAYVAVVQGTAAAKTTPKLTFAGASGSPDVCNNEPVCEIGYSSSSDLTTINFTWNLSTTADADDVVLNFPAEPLLAIYAIEEDGTALNGCIFAQTGNGVTCPLPSPLSAGSSHTIKLTTTASAQAANSGSIGTSFTLNGNAADAEGEYQAAPQGPITVAKPVQITLAYAQGPSNPVNASSDTAGTGGTTVTYTATVANTGTTDSPNTLLTLTALPAEFKMSSITAVVGATNVGAQCDLTTTGTGCSRPVDVPAGQSLNYTITGVYLGPSFGGTNPGPFTHNFTATAVALPKTQTSQPSQVALSTTINGSAALSVSVKAPNYPSGQNAFSLNSGSLTYTVTVTNNGTNAAGSFSLANTLFTGFAVTSTTCAPSVSNCNNAGTGFTAPSLAAGATETYTINGSFTDHGAAGGDAVPTSAATSTVTDTATISAQPTGTFDAGIPVSGSATVNVQRSVHLKINIRSIGSLPAASYPNQPAYNLGTAIGYTYTITNTGPSTDFNVPFANMFTTSIASNFVTVTPPANGVTCTSSYISCTISSVPGNGSATFTFTVVYPDNPPPTFPLPASFSAVPTNATNAAYNYMATMTPYTDAVDSNPAGSAAGDNKTNYAVNVYRTSALTLTPSVSGLGAPCASGAASKCLYMANSGNGTGQNDTATYTVQINNGGPNLATNSTLTIPLPTNFLVTANPSVAFTGLATAGVTNQLVCAYQGAPNAVVCTGYVPLAGSTATVISKFSTSTVPANTAFTTTATAPNTPGSGSVTASAINSNSSTTLPTVEIDRAAHLVAVKLVNPAPGNVSPNGFTVNGVVAVNLDEKVAGDANGKNDTVQITEQVGNAGLNDATGVVLTDTLPQYFILTKMPDPTVASCVVHGTTPDAAGNPMTGAGAATLVCTLLNPLLRGTATAGTGTSHGTVTGSFIQLVYYGKFEDNGLQPDAIPLTASSMVVPIGTLTASSNDEVNLGAGTDSTSAAVAPIPVMRAAHLHFTLTQYVQTNDAALNVVGGVTGPGIAEAQLGANGGEVINPVRFQVQVTNDGPNIAIDPTVNTTLPLNPNGAATMFTNVAQSIESSSTTGTPATSSCATGQVCNQAGMIATGTAVLYNVDGNFNVNTLTEGNFGTRTFAAAISDPSVVDSNPTATAGGAQQTSLPITVVNTPVGANFTLAPFTASLAQPLNLKLTTVQTAGITIATAAG